MQVALQKVRQQRRRRGSNAEVQVVAQRVAADSGQSCRFILELQNCRSSTEVRVQQRVADVAQRRRPSTEKQPELQKREESRRSVGRSAAAEIFMYCCRGAGSGAVTGTQTKVALQQCKLHLRSAGSRAEASVV